MTDSDIITRCPQCNTVFRVTNHQLSVANGVVRCGSCLALFKAMDFKTPKKEAAVPVTQTRETQRGALPRQPSGSGPAGSKNRVKEAVEDHNNQFINDGVNETSLYRKDGISRLNTSDESGKTNLFERKLQPITHTQDPVDESWALDMLSALKDEKDDSRPSRIRSESKTEKDPWPKSTPRPEIEHKQQQPQKHKSPKHKAKNPAEPFRVSRTDSEVKDLNTNALDFNQEAMEGSETETRSTIKPFSDSTKLTTDHDFRQKMKDSGNARRTKTQRPNESKHYLNGIEPAPIEMEWFEFKNTRRWLWVPVAFFLGLLLVIQIAFYRFESLSLVSSYRPFYRVSCNVLGCQLPDLVDYTKIRTVNLVVRSHPSQQNALIVDAVIINQAAFAQPYPGLRMEFKDINNRLLAARNFQPGQYLRGELAGATQMPSGQPIQISLGIIDPGEAAVNYQLSVVKAKTVN